MGRANQPGDRRPLDPRNGLETRAPSQDWEEVPLADDGQLYFWAWFKPANVPQGLVLRIPDEIDASDPQLAGLLTIRRLLQTAGVDPNCVSMWHVHGVAFDAMNGTNPLLDSPLPAAVEGMDPNIVVYLNDAYAGAAADPAAEEARLTELFDRMESDWAASLELEKELSRLRKRLVDIDGKLKILNRDLTPQERLYSDNQDKKDWLEARRWLRECRNRASRCIKDHDIGDTSAAGHRKWFAQMYEQYVESRIPFDNMLQTQRDFEFRRKMLQTLQLHMNNAHSTAVFNGERRANQVLKRIAEKIRAATARKTFIDVIIDGTSN